MSVFQTQIFEEVCFCTHPTWHGQTILSLGKNARKNGPQVQILLNPNQPINLSEDSAYEEAEAKKNRPPNTCNRHAKEMTVLEILNTWICILTMFAYGMYRPCQQLELLLTRVAGMKLVVQGLHAYHQDLLQCASLVMPWSCKCCCLCWGWNCTHASKTCCMHGNIASCSCMHVAVHWCT